MPVIRVKRKAEASRTGTGQWVATIDVGAW